MPWMGAGCIGRTPSFGVVSWPSDVYGQSKNHNIGARRPRVNSPGAAGRQEPKERGGGRSDGSGSSGASNTGRPGTGGRPTAGTIRCRAPRSGFRFSATMVSQSAVQRTNGPPNLWHGSHLPQAIYACPKSVWCRNLGRSHLPPSRRGRPLIDGKAAVMRGGCGGSQGLGRRRLSTPYRVRRRVAAILIVHHSSFIAPLRRCVLIRRCACRKLGAGRRPPQTRLRPRTWETWRFRSSRWR